jgi:hypothetical protein
MTPRSGYTRSKPSFISAQLLSSSTQNSTGLGRAVTPAEAEATEREACESDWWGSVTVPGAVPGAVAPKKLPAAAGLVAAAAAAVARG